MIHETTTISYQAQCDKCNKIFAAKSGNLELLLHNLNRRGWRKVEPTFGKASLVYCPDCISNPNPKSE